MRENCHTGKGQGEERGEGLLKGFLWHRHMELEDQIDRTVALVMLERTLAGSAPAFADVCPLLGQWPKVFARCQDAYCTDSRGIYCLTNKY